MTKRAQLLLAVPVSMFAVAVVVLASGSSRPILLSLIVIALILPLWRRMASRRFDLFEPIVVANLTLAVLFVARPLALILAGQFVHDGYDIQGGFDDALLVALVGVVALEVGYELPAGRRLAARLPRAPADLRVASTVAGAGVIAILGLSLYSLFIFQSGGISSLMGLLAGRASNQNQLYLASTGYLYNGLLMAGPAGFGLLVVARHGNRLLVVPAMLLISAVAVLAVGNGGRIVLLPLIASPCLFWYLHQNRRPRPILLAAVAFLVLTVGIGALRDSRTVGATGNSDRVGAAVAAMLDPVGGVSDLMLGADTEMFDSLATEVQIVPSRLDYDPGATIRDFAIRVVPRPLWPDKPLESNDRVVSALWPEHYAAVRASPAFSLLGPFYLDSGLLGCFVGMLVVGILLRSIWAYFKRLPHAIGAQMMTATLIPFVPILLRGTLPDTASRMLFMVVPLLLLIAVAGVRSDAGSSPFKLPPGG